MIPKAGVNNLTSLNNTKKGFNFSKFLNFGNRKPEENNAQIEAIETSLGMGGKSKNVINGLLDDSTKSDVNDVQDVLSIFGIGQGGGK